MIEIPYKTGAVIGDEIRMLFGKMVILNTLSNATPPDGHTIYTHYMNLPTGKVLLGHENLHRRGDDLSDS